MRIPFGIVVVLLGSLSVSAVALAQLAPSPDAPPVSNAPDTTQDEKPIATFKLSVDLVDVVFTVKDKNGNLVPHLTKADCTVSEDKQQQTLKSFVTQTDQPLTIGMLLDTSYSQVNVLPLEQQAGGEFFDHVLRAKDEAFIVSVDVNVDLLQDLTNSTRSLSRALNKAQINAGVGGFGPGPVPTQGQPRGTLLYDAIYLASHEKMTEETGRKALILLTDGEDQGSKTKIEDAIAAAQKANVIIYVILIADPRGYFSQGLGYYGYSPMKKVAEETGGRLIDVGNNANKLQTAFEQIQDELRTQYIATYTPSNTKLDGTFRRIGIECGEGTKVQVRKGYFAPKGGQE